MKLAERSRNELMFFSVLVGVLVLLNLVSTRVFFRLDLTRSNAYSLSKISKTYMRELKDPLTVKAFFSRNLPAPYNANARYLRDLLQDYRLYSNGKLNYTFIDPADDPALANEARSLGVYEVQLTAIERDKFEQKKSYMGVALVYRDHREVLPLIQDTNGLEYQLTSAIKKMMQKQAKKVGVVQGYGAPSLFEEMGNFQQLIAKNYEVRPVDLSTGGIPDDLDALVVPSVTETIPDEKLYLVDHFLRSGKNLAMLASPVKADARTSMQGRVVETGLPRLLAAWGVKIQPDLVYDTQCQKIAVSQRGPGFIMQNIVPYPPFPLVTDLNRDNVMLKNIESLTLPFVSSLSVEEDVVKQNNLTVSVLAKSSKQAWRQKGFFVLSPQYIGMPQPQDVVQSDLMLTLSGPFASAYSPDRLPVPAKAGDVLPAFVAQAKPARLLVIGGSDFLTNDFIDPRRGGELVQFSQNLVDWVAQDSALIEIRSKGLAAAPLAQVTEWHRWLVKYFNLVGLPLLVALAGLMMWRAMNNRRQWVASQFKV